MNLVWRTSPQSGSALLLLLALADHATDEALAWPRIETLAAWTRLGERSVRRILRHLEAAGELSIAPLSGDRRRHAYRLDPYRPAEADTGSPGPLFAGPGQPVSPARYRASAAGDRRPFASGESRSPGSTPSKDEPSVKPPPNPKGDSWSSRVEQVLRLWAGMPPEVERPPARRVRVWLAEWGDDAALLAELRDLEARGALTISVNYVHACLASARRQGPARPGWARDRVVAEMQATGVRDPEPPFDLESRLARLAAALPDTLPGRDRWQERIRRLAGGIETIEATLGAIEDELLALFEQRLGGDAGAAVEQRVAAALRPVEARLSATERRQAAAGLRRRLLRRDAGLPQLSLFSPAADDEPPPPEVHGGV